MKTPYYTGTFTAAQHTETQDDDQLRERMLAHRLANRDDVRDISIVTTAPLSARLGGSVGTNLIEKASEKSKTALSWAMHWALQVGDQFFELQRGYPDPMRTGLRMSKWSSEKQGHIIRRYPQGSTAMADDEIRAIGERYFSRLQRIDINIYDVWCNNCQLAIDHMLHDIGGLFYYRAKLESLHEMVRQSFYNSILTVTKLYARYRGWNEEIIDKHAKLLHDTLQMMTSRSKYPKRHWIQVDIEMAEGVSNKAGAVTDHWFLTVLESSLSLKKGSEELYVRRGADGKPELNLEAVGEATKGIFDEHTKNWRLGWLKAMPWLTAGFALGTVRWAAAVISIAVSHASQLYEHHVGLKGGLEESLVGLGVSPNPENVRSAHSTSPKTQNRKRQSTGQRRVRGKNPPVDGRLIARFDRRLTAKGVPYFYDNINKTWTWETPDQQELCLRITKPALSKRWEEQQAGGHTFYVNRLTGEKIDDRPGPPEIWAVKKKVKPDWVKSTVMAVPCGWEMCRTQEGEMYYLNHNDDPPTSTLRHPMRQEIEEERRVLLPEWNVEWDDDRGKKYRNIQTREIHWKAVDGPRYVSNGEKTKISFESQESFVEPLPPGWTVTVRDDGQTIYKNGKTGKDRIERITHPLRDIRRRLLPEWEMRYTSRKRRYWVHHGRDGRGTSWWTRNRLLKNTSLKNNASGWKLAKNGYDWEWFEGGDVQHTDIPVLDLDDPAEIEFREYPFILPRRITTLQGEFMEPLPIQWVRRIHDDGSTYYWNFKDGIRLHEHPNEEERRNLPALWEMRYTRHGRQYYIDHDDASTWWTHPRRNKHEQKLRARPGQSQDGWKLAKDGNSWERFEEHPDAELTEERADASSSAPLAESETSQDEQRPEVWRSLTFTREWLKRGNSSEAVAKAIAHIPKTPEIFKKHKSSPSIDSIASERSVPMSIEESEFTGVGRDVDSPAMTEEPQQMDEPQHKRPSLKGQVENSFAQARDPRTLLKRMEHSSSFRSNVSKASQEALRAERPDEDKSQKDTEPVIEQAQAGEGANTTDPPRANDSKKSWRNRTPILSALKKSRGKKDGEGESSVSNDEDHTSIDGLGITGAERVDSGVEFAEGNDAGKDALEKGSVTEVTVKNLPDPRSH